MQVTIFKDLFSEDFETKTYQRVSWKKLLQKGKKYLININGINYTDINELPKLAVNDIVVIREIPQAKKKDEPKIALDPATEASKNLTIGGSAFATMTLLNKKAEITEQENKIGINEVFPAIYGTYSVTPKAAGNFFSSFEFRGSATVQTVTALLTLGYGDILIESVRLGDIVIAKNLSLSAEAYILPNAIETLTDKKYGKPEIKLMHAKGALPSSYGTSRRTNLIIQDTLVKNGSGTENRNQFDYPVPAGATIATIKFNYFGGLGQVIPNDDDAWGGVWASLTQTIRVHIKDKSGNILSENVFKHTGNIYYQQKIFNETFFIPNNAHSLSIFIPETGENTADNIKNGRHCCQPIINNIDYILIGTSIVAETLRELNLISLKIDVFDSTKDLLNKLNVTVSRKLPVYSNGNWNTSNYSANPAAIVRDMLTGRHLSEPQPLDMVDNEAFSQLYLWCEQKRYKFNYVFDEEDSLISCVNKVLSVCQASLVMKGGKYSILHDKERPQPLAIICPANSYEFSYKLDSEKPPTSVRVTFYDETKEYTKNQVQIRLVGDSTPDTNVISIEPEGVTTYDMACKIGRYLLAANKLRPESYSLMVGAENFYFPLGSRLLLQQTRILNGLGSGRVRRINANNNIIILDEEFDTDKTKRYGLNIEVGYGDILKIEVKPYSGDKNVFQAVNYVPDNNLTGKFYAFGELGKETIDVIVSGKSAVSSGDYAGSLDLLPYSEEIFSAIEKPIDDFGSGITIGKKPLSSEIYNDNKDIANEIIFADDNNNLIVGTVPLDKIADFTPPYPITTVTALQRANITALIKWMPTTDNPNGSGLSGYLVYRCKNYDKSDAKNILSVKSGILEALDDTAELNEYYFYGASAIDRNYNECPITWIEEPIQAVYLIPPDIPTNLTAVAEKGAVKLKWQPPKNAGDVTYYEIWKLSGEEWAELDISGTPSYIEEIGRVEKETVSTWKYKVRAYNLYEVYGDFDTKDGIVVDVIKYGTYLKSPLTPQLTAVGDSIVVNFPKQYNLMDFKAVHIQVSRDGLDWYDLSYKGENPTEIEKGSFTETASTITHGALFLEKESIITDGETQYLPVKTLYKYRMRQVSEDGEALDWNDEFTPIAEIYAEPLDILKLNVGNLSVQGGKFLSMQGGTMKGFAKDDNLPISQRIEAGDASLNYWDLTNNKMRLGTLGNYMLVDYAKNLVAFKGTELQLDQSSLTTNADNIYLKHEGRGLTWGNEDFSIEHGTITADAKNLKIKASEIKLEGNNIQISGNLLAPVIKATNKIESKQFLSALGALGGYSFINDADTGMFSDYDGDLYFKKNNVKQDINSLLGGALSIAKGGTGATTADAARTALGAASMDHLHNNVSIFRFFGFAYTNMPGLDHFNTYEPPNAIHVPGITWDFVEQRDTNLTKLPTKDAFLLTIEASIYRGFQLCFDWVTNRRWSRIRHDDTGQGRWGGWREF